MGIHRVRNGLEIAKILNNEESLDDGGGENMGRNSGAKNKSKIPQFLTKVKNFTTSMAKIALDGFQTVPQEELDRRWSICRGCEKFVEKEGYAVCSLEKGGCSCRLSDDSTRYINKLLYKKSRCPDKPPKWTEYEEKNE